MKSTIDIVVAASDKFDEILLDVNNTLELDVATDTGVSIDDVVGIVSVLRGILDDRQAWWKLRREVYARFASHETIDARTLAAIPDSLCGEIAALEKGVLDSLAASWISIDDATPSDVDAASRSLEILRDSCSRAAAAGNCVMLRTNQPPNAFEQAFSQLEGKQLRNFQKSFDQWDASKKYEAHQRYNYYLKQEEDDCLNQVLRDFTRRKTVKVNLKTDQRTLRRHIVKRIKEYRKAPSPELGDPADPITMISLTFDIEYEGYVDLVFNTLPDAAEEIRWEDRCEDCLEFPHWNEGAERFGCEGLALKMTLQDGSKVTIEPDVEDEDEYDNYIGNMLRETMIEVRDKGEFDKLPLAANCVMWIGGTHTNYSWPDLERLAQDGHAAKKVE